MKKLFSAIAFAAAVSCVNYPLDTQRDLYEMESVWQYLKTYSIWQERVPASAFTEDSPETMLYNINDTLKGNRYTGYDNRTCGACAAPIGSVGQSDAGDTLYWTAFTDSTMFLQIREFTESTYRQFLSAIIDMHSSYDFRNIIIDLRHNGGGDIQSTDSIIEAILPAQTPYLVETYRAYNRDGRSAKTIDAETQITKGPQNWALHNKRYAILVDYGSASASEMLIAALKEGFSQAGQDSVVIIGTTTYGKGIGQICIPRQYLHRQDLKITFMRMKGLGKIGDYHEKGIVPDVISEEKTEQESIALHILEPSAHLPKQATPHYSLQPPAEFPPEAVVEPSADDRTAASER